MDSISGKTITTIGNVVLVRQLEPSIDYITANRLDL